MSTAIIETKPAPSVQESNVNGAPVVAAPAETHTDPMYLGDPEVDEWGDRILEAIGDGVRGLVAIGQQLNEAKKVLGHGRWMALFLSGRLEIGISTAETLMRIASHPGISDSYYIGNLPPRISVLNELARLDETTFVEAFNDCSISTALTLKQARALRLERGGAVPRAKTTVPFNLGKRTQVVESWILAKAIQWPQDRHRDLADTLTRAADRLRSGTFVPGK